MAVHLGESARVYRQRWRRRLVCPDKVPGSLFRILLIFEFGSCLFYLQRARRLAECKREQTSRDSVLVIGQCGACQTIMRKEKA